jgi:hypothetical protein
MGNIEMNCCSTIAKDADQDGDSQVDTVSDRPPPWPLVKSLSTATTLIPEIPPEPGFPTRMDVWSAEIPVMPFRVMNLSELRNSVDPDTDFSS